MNMWSEYYPYAAGSTAIGSVMLRPESLEGLGLKYEEVIYDPSLDKFLSKEEYLQIVKQDPGRTIVAFNPARNEWMDSWLKTPHMTSCSDAMWTTDPNLNWDSDPADFSGHPRTSGSRSITLRLAREADVPLMFTLAQLSYWSALHLGDAGLESMKVRGRLQEGMVADIVIFEPETIREGSSYKNGEQGLPPHGLPHVIVNGIFVKKDNKDTSKFPGQPIHYPVEDKPRHVPASKKQWLKTFTIDTGALARKLKSIATTSSIDRNPQLIPAPFTSPVYSSIDPLDTNMWFGDRQYQTLGYCCLFHMQQARALDMEQKSSTQ